MGTGDGVTLARYGSGKPRKLHGLAFVGGANAADAAFTLQAGGKIYGTFYNSTGGANIAPKMDADLQPIYSEDILPIGVPLVGLCTDAGATNVYIILLSWEDKPGIKGAFRSDVSYSSMRPRSYGGGGYSSGRRTTRRRRSSR